MIEDKYYKKAIIGLLKFTCLVLLSTNFLAASFAADKPNIIWLVSEDNSANLGSYGDLNANTPNLDQLAQSSVQFNNAFATSPVCAAVRFTIYTGMYANVLGTQNMRSRYAVPKFVNPYAHYLEKAGYYLTNSALKNNGTAGGKGKNDFNHKTQESLYWQKGTYKNRAKGQPFFHIYNSGITHESAIHSYDAAKLTHKPSEMKLPPYHPDTLDVREDWARYYDALTNMDSAFGKVIDDLKASGDYENTIIFYYSDHGGILARSKRFLFDSGTHVPLMIRVPQKWQHLSPFKMGSQVNNMVTLADLAPTLMHLSGMPMPKHFHGKNMLSDKASDMQEYAYLYRNRMDERFDLVRALRDKKFKYIRNYLPHRPNGQYLEYLWNAKSTRSWEATCKAGNCNQVQKRFFQPKVAEELYDTDNDPWEVNNLANNPKYKAIIDKMRTDLNAKNRQYMDAAFIPEGEKIERTKKSNAYDLVRSKNFPFEKVISTAEMASSGKTEHLNILTNRLSDKEAVVRYWAAVGMIILKPQANKQVIVTLTALLNDSSGDVQIAAAEALWSLNQDKRALTTLGKQLENENSFILLHAANVIDQLGEKAKPLLPKMKSIYAKLDGIAKKVNYKAGRYNKYVMRSLSRSIKLLSNTSEG